MPLSLVIDRRLTARTGWCCHTPVPQDGAPDEFQSLGQIAQRILDPVIARRSWRIIRGGRLAGERELGEAHETATRLRCAITT